jgi:membrane protease YdiL (CAAX protease family)
VGLFRYPSFPSSFAIIGWKVATMAILILAVRLFESRSADLRDTGLVPARAQPRSRRARVAIPGIIAMVLLSFAWSSIPGLRSLDSSGSGSSYEAGTVTAAILAFELIVRYPVTVAVEEAFFRGFLLPRITVAAPVVTGVLFGLYHLQQWRTIPSIIPFGIALGLLRWWLGSIWPGAALHYVGNALFILALYRP